MILDYLFDPNMTLYLANQSLLGIIDALQKIFCWFADIMPFGQESLLGDSYNKPPKEKKAKNKIIKKENI